MAHRSSSVYHARKHARRGEQLGLTFRTWGGCRKGAGRKPGPRPRTPHRMVPALASRHPVHVTLKVDEALPSLRGAELRSYMKECLRCGREREGFRLVHFSVQEHHLHLIVEAKSAQALRGGVSGITIRLARRINRVLGRTGRVFCDRYFPRVLKTPRQTRAAILYVINNSRRHAAQRGQKLARGWVDDLSSGRWFDGWRNHTRPLGAPPRLGPTRRSDEGPVVVAPGTWLLSAGWRRHGLLDVNAVPGAT
jgi:putative transposase